MTETDTNSNTIFLIKNKIIVLEEKKEKLKHDLVVAERLGFKFEVSYLREALKYIFDEINDLKEIQKTLEKEESDDKTKDIVDIIIKDIN